MQGKATTKVLGELSEALAYVAVNHFYRKGRKVDARDATKGTTKVLGDFVCSLRTLRLNLLPKRAIEETLTEPNKSRDRTLWSSEAV